jgi:hypothetical protein
VIASFVRSLTPGVSLGSLPHVGLPWRATACLCSCHWGERACDDKRCVRPDRRAAIVVPAAVSAADVVRDSSGSLPTTTTAGAHSSVSVPSPVSSPSPVTDETISAQVEPTLDDGAFAARLVVDTMALGLSAQDAADVAHALIPSKDEDILSALMALGLTDDDALHAALALGA